MNNYLEFLLELSDEDDESTLVVERRQYKMLERIDIDNWDDQDFFQRFRLNKSTVAKVQANLSYSLERPRFIRPMVQLLIALRFYALGSMQISIADFAGVSTASVCNILPNVTKAIAKNRPRFIKMPETIAEMATASEDFLKFARFPRTIGAIDLNVIERTFGVMKRRFTVLSMGMSLKLTTIKPIIVACAVLHNIAVDENENVPPIEIEGFDEIMVVTDIPNINTSEPNEQNARDFLVNNYFRTL